MISSSDAFPIAEIRRTPNVTDDLHAQMRLKVERWALGQVFDLQGAAYKGLGSVDLFYSFWIVS